MRETKNGENEKKWRNKENEKMREIGKEEKRKTEKQKPHGKEPYMDQFLKPCDTVFSKDEVSFCQRR